MSIETKSWLYRRDDKAVVEARVFIGDEIGKKIKDGWQDNMSFKEIKQIPVEDSKKSSKKKVSKKG